MIPLHRVRTHPPSERSLTMPPAATAPYPVSAPRLREEDWADEPGLFQTYRAFFELTGPADPTTMTRAEIILEGYEAVMRNREPWNRFDDHRITRIELITERRPDSGLVERRGVIFFSQRGAELYCRHALIGYGGAGSALTEYLFKVLLIDHNIFEQVDSAARDKQFYHLAVSRERTDRIEGVETALPWSDPLSTWRWWQLT